MVITVILVGGCATGPVQQVDASHYSTPKTGTAGVYFYQWKTGILGAGSDVKFVLDGQVLGAINTGEWLYFEVPTGKHKYRFKGGLFPIEIEHDFREKQNYFFRGILSNFTDTVFWINDLIEIDDTMKHIQSGRYEKGDID